LTAELLLSKLDKVKKTGPGKWSARCPTRDDKSPSLAVRELDDGTVLLHDFGGDDVSSILASIGLTFSDLYPPKPTSRGPVRRAFNASDLLDLVAFEASVAAIVLADVLKWEIVTEQDWDRLATAAQRLGNAAEVCHAR
jgi:hypothetical protein